MISYNVMGSIGSMMKGSELEEALEIAYGPNAVIQILSISTAVREHYFLVEAALVNKLISALLSSELNTNPETDRDDDLH